MAIRKSRRVITRLPDTPPPPPPRKAFGKLLVGDRVVNTLGRVHDVFSVGSFTNSKGQIHLGFKDVSPPYSTHMIWLAADATVEVVKHANT